MKHADGQTRPLHYAFTSSTGYKERTQNVILV